MRCWIVLLNNATEVYVEVIVETGERFRSSALPRLPNRLNPFGSSKTSAQPAIPSMPSTGSTDSRDASHVQIADVWCARSVHA